MNFFQNIETDEHASVRCNQIASTRLYIILWTMSLVVLSVYNGLYRVRSSFEVNNPSINVFEQYQSQNVDELTCPCSKVVIPFQIFTSLDFTLHQVD